MLFDGDELMLGISRLDCGCLLVVSVRLGSGSSGSLKIFSCVLWKEICFFVVL